jgi:hypothetical protein
VSCSLNHVLRLKASLHKARYKYPGDFEDTEDLSSYIEMDFSTTVSGLSGLIDCLFDLSSSVETIPVDYSPSEGSEEGDISHQQSIPGDKEDSYAYLGNIQDTFPNAAECLVKRLALINWNRHKMIRGLRTLWETEQIVQDDYGTIAKDSGYETM